MGDDGEVDSTKDTDWIDEAGMGVLLGASTPVKTSKKRRPEPCSPSGFTPQQKTGRSALTIATLTIADIQDVLSRSLRAEEGCLVSRTAILKDLDSRGLKEVSHYQLGRAITRQFPLVKRVGQRDQFQNITIISSQPQPRKHVVRGIDFSMDARPKMQQTSSTIKNPPPSTSYEMPNLSFDEVKLVKALRCGDGEFVIKLLMNKGFDQAIIFSVFQTMSNEIKSYCKEHSDALLQHSSASQLMEFSLAKLAEEFRDKVPTLMEMVTSLIQRPDNDKAAFQKQNVATTIVSKILGSYNQTLSSFRFVTSIILDAGGAKDSCIQRLATIKDTVTPQVLRNKLDEMSALTPLIIKDWDIPRVNSTIVYDNVNPYVKPRHQTQDRGNTLYSMTHGLMMKDRVDTSHLSSRPAMAISELSPADIMPGEIDRQLITDCFARILRNVWAENLLGFEWMKLDIPKHKHSKETRTRTEFVNLGVMMKDENKIEELLEIIAYYHTFVPTTSDGHLDHKLCFGDYLSFRNGKLAQETQADLKEPERRREGLIMALADFHAMMNLLDATYKTAFTADSSRSPGSLSHAKTYLNAGNAGTKGDASKKYYDSSELADKVFEAYVITELLDRLMMNNQDTDCPLPLDQRTKSKAAALAQEFIDKYVNLDLPGPKSVENTKKCPHCRKIYKTSKGLTGHLEKVHPEKPELMADPDSEDGILAYTMHYVTMSLLRLALKEAVRAGNGTQVMSVYRYMFIICKAVGNFNYANGLAETLMQLKILPEKLAESLVWNRFCNSRGKYNSNMPIDLFMEHENKTFQAQLTTYRGVYTQPPIDRISKSQTVVDSILRNYDRETRRHQPGSKDTKPVSKEDVMKLVTLYRAADLFANKPGRNHSPQLVFIRPNIMKCLSAEDVNLWLAKKFKYLEGVHYYKQFQKTEESEEEIWTNLETSFNDLSFGND